MQDQTVTLPLYCLECGQLVDLSYNPTKDNQTVSWTCPYHDCEHVHELELRGSVVRVVSRHEQRTWMGMMFSESPGTIERRFRCGWCGCGLTLTVSTQGVTDLLDPVQTSKQEWACPACDKTQAVRLPGTVRVTRRL